MGGAARPRFGKDKAAGRRHRAAHLLSAGLRARATRSGTSRRTSVPGAVSCMAAGKPHTHQGKARQRVNAPRRKTAPPQPQAGGRWRRRRSPAAERRMACLVGVSRPASASLLYEASSPAPSPPPPSCAAWGCPAGTDWNAVTWRGTHGTRARAWRRFAETPCKCTSPTEHTGGGCAACVATKALAHTCTLPALLPASVLNTLKMSPTKPRSMVW